jgi:hypothetical protein
MLRRHTIKPLSLHQRSATAIDPNKYAYEENFHFRKYRFLNFLDE